MERRRDGGRIAQRLRRHPVLAVTAMEIAAEHAEAVRQRPRMHMKKWLLLDRVALHAADVAPGYVQLPIAVEAYLAHADRTVGERATMSARVTAEPAVRQSFVQIAFTRFAREHLSQRCHGSMAL